MCLSIAKMQHQELVVAIKHTNIICKSRGVIVYVRAKYVGRRWAAWVRTTFVGNAARFEKNVL
jgi:hypothetical protein